MTARRKRSRARTAAPRPTAARRAGAGATILVAGLAFALYANTLGHGYALDDDFVTVKNRYVQQGLSGIPSILTRGYFSGFDGTNDKQYRPLVLLTFALEKSLVGEDPRFHHLVNVLLYMACAGAALALLRALMPDADPSVPLAAALLFVVHPVHVEAVANVKSRDELLAFLLVAMALHQALRHVDRGAQRLPLAAAGLFGLACLSKESAITAVAVVPAMLLVFRRPTRATVARATATFALAAAAYLVVRTVVLDAGTYDRDLDVINNSLMAATTRGEWYGTALLVLAKYARLVVLPHPLAWDYSLATIPVVGLGSAPALASLALHAALAGFALTGLRTRSPASFGVLFYLVGISLVSHLVVRIGATMGERFLFTPSFGICLAAASFVAWHPRAGPRRIDRGRFVGLSVLLLVAAILTISRNRAWKDNDTLFAWDMAHTSGSARAHFSLAAAVRTRGEATADPAARRALIEDSIRENRAALAIYPRYAQAAYNLGVSHQDLGHVEPALDAYRRALAVDPRLKEAENNVGVLLFGQGDVSGALAAFERALLIDPAFADAVGNVGACYHNLGDHERARANYLEALRLNPANARIRQGLADLDRAAPEPVP